MLRNLEAEQKRMGLNNSQMAQILSISRVTYESKKKNGMFLGPQIKTMIKLFNCNFEYLFYDDAPDEKAG